MRQGVLIWRLTDGSSCKMNGALDVMLGSFIASWGMSALYFIVGMSSILLFMKAIGKEKYEEDERNVSQIDETI